MKLCMHLTKLCVKYGNKDGKLYLWQCHINLIQIMYQLRNDLVCIPILWMVKIHLISQPLILTIPTIVSVIFSKPPKERGISMTSKPPPIMRRSIHGNFPILSIHNSTIQFYGILTGAQIGEYLHVDECLTINFLYFHGKYLLLSRMYFTLLCSAKPYKLKQ